MFIKESYTKRRVKDLLRFTFNKLENNGNCNFKTNGEKVFIDNLLLSLNKNKGKKVIFDIGANIGEYSTIILNKSNNIDIDLHLFEPTQSCFKVLVENFSGKSNIKLNNFGVSNENVNSIIYYDNEKSGLASLYQRNLDSYNIELNKQEAIQLKRLDNYIENNNIPHINFIKIDIEGHELNAFEGFGKYLNEDFIDYIQFEYGGGENLDSHTSLMDLYNLLTNKGFNIAKIMPKGLIKRNYKPYMDNFNYANYIAYSKNLNNI
jgi:FkbM family methyltransferase